MRIFAVTGGSAALATLSKARSASSGLSARAAPSPFFTTFGAGQPRLRSMTEKPSGLRASTAFLSVSVSEPTSWTPTQSSDASLANRLIVFFAPKTREPASIISVKAKRHPCLLADSLMGMSVCPARGASTAAPAGYIL